MIGNHGDRSGDVVLDLAAYRAGRNNTDMIHAEIRALYDYWERLRAGRPCPYRAEVDPRDMAADARHLFVLEDLGQGNMRFRLCGTALVDAFGYDLRGMSAKSIMAGAARESIVALVAETLAECGVGYARLLSPDGRTAWELLLLPLRDNFGQVERLIGCLHPISGRTPDTGGEALRFTIDEMWIQPVGTPADTFADAMPLPGFGEGQAQFDGPVAAPVKNSLTAIEGGRSAEPRADAKRPTLRVVRDEEE